MNFRSFTRGDGAVIGAAVLLLIASFLPFETIKVPDLVGSGPGIAPVSNSLWHEGYLDILGSVTLAGLIVAALFAVARLRGEGTALLGLGLRQWGTALAVFTVWATIWAMFAGGQYETHAAGAWLSLLFALVLAAAAVLSDRHPALKAPLLGAPKPPRGQGYPQPYGPGQPGGGYGYPGADQNPSFGGRPQQPGSPTGGMTPEPAAPYGAPADAPEFAPFWFAVPVARPLYPEDGSAGPVADLTPGTWYLAVDQRGPALVAQTQDGRRGVLQDTTGIQRG
ncbi:hypothetical protein [Streptantibioticus silvisoli]|uniref:Integral membrane protein n=1 Tax=Streptantibioticus silvisoli TaxID=2705255 RepID=A0ABT6VSW6_9ACTN|nr:hypothetical protein [Streptantibioticus silvisoli]MDI5961572.1 hypothetical protein [Streptantibioticus silvisoli]